VDRAASGHSARPRPSREGIVFLSPAAFAGLIPTHTRKRRTMSQDKIIVLVLVLLAVGALIWLQRSSGRK